MSPAALPAALDFSDPDLWADRTPVEEFALLRRTSPVWWNGQSDEMCAPYHDGGFWVVTRHEDVREISRSPALFSSNANGAILRFPGDVSPDAFELTKTMLVNMDPPKHSKVRRIISRGFTPRAVEALRAALAERAGAIVHAARQTGGGDFVDQVARELPLQAIAELLGVPQEDRLRLFDWSNEMLNFDDPEYGDPTVATAGILGYAWQMAETRRQDPGEDLVSKLVTADIDGESLTPDEFGFFMILLTVAGNETTRNATTHGMKAFVDHPEQWEIFKQQRPRTAPDEIVRWATPVIAFQRTATQDVELGGQAIRAGQRVAMFYSSANFDEEAFDDPSTFDILRDPNPHLGFGGTGPHYCVGANLARLQLELIFDAIADVMPGLRQVAEPARLRSSFVNGIKHWHVRYA
ncbi:cytochrome P450 [Nocardia puris]|uniref:cytochrome P450 n=1 Tax=Nocardia puris TaxID=208602 RepID=UPI001894756E|nr:cytochrome P450 [Nocardia puris]MBF6209694.1 cytochrome P450 [Nocardia puris]MBF6366266.1 cytochrome P450 [Nocardia puris]MBF6458395.1 cytochrome P450 [Nocardia puris]